jgi:hypothetical protein
VPQDFKDNLDVLDYVYDKFENKKQELGIEYVARMDEELLPVYPAMLISMERPLQRTLHATGMFHITFNVDLYVYHAKLTQGKAIRSREDIELATNVRKTLHADYTLGDHIIFGYVTGEYPGVTTRVIGQKARSVVTTRMTWEGTNRVLFEDS